MFCTERCFFIFPAIITLALFTSLASHGFLTEESQVLLQLEFENSLAGQEGEEPTSQQNVAFYDTPTGRGARVEEDGILQYAADQNISASAGKIILVIQKKWEESPVSHFLMIIGNHTNGIEINKDQGQYLRFLTWSNGREFSLSYDTSSWLVDSWHTIQAKWNAEMMQLYVDGELVDQETEGYFAPRSLTSPITIGGNPGFQTVSDIVFDSITIYRIPETEPPTPSYWVVR